MIPNHSSKNREPSEKISLLTQIRQVRSVFQSLFYRPGVFTPNYLFTAGFKYTGHYDTARCDYCGLEVIGWTKDMNPFRIHSEQSPDCLFVCNRRMQPRPSLFLSTTAVPSAPILNEHRNTAARRDIETVDSERLTNCLVESDLLQRVRKRTFSHWSHDGALSGTQMTKAGFFLCNVKGTQDRVMCIYCDLICQQWTPHTDHPCDVHKTLSPDCKFVKALLTYHGPIFILNGDGSSMTPIAVGPSSATNTINSLRISRIAQSYNVGTIQNNAPSNNRSAPIDDHIQSSYFNVDTEAMVTCIACRRAFRELGRKENPMIDHARQFPPCPYARQFCLLNYPGQRTIQHDDTPNATLFMDNGQLVELDEANLSRIVADRLKLALLQTSLNQCHPSIIRQCLENQIRLRGHDFITNLDLAMACLILQKQFDPIGDRKNKIIIPSKSMRQSRKRAIEEQTERLAKRRADRGLTSSSTVINGECVVCQEGAREVACLPCGHLASCVPCGYSLKKCPICRQEIEAFVRIYT